MYSVVRNGPVQQHASNLRRGKLPRPVFICCGSVGVILTVIGGIVLGIGQRKFKKDIRDYTFILAGSIALGFGFILTILAVFLSISWSTLAAPDYEPPTSRRTSRTSGGIGRESSLAHELEDDVELNGYRSSIRKTREEL